MSDSQKMNEITNGLVSDLPEGWVWCRMDEIAKINPRHPLNVLPENVEASFLPMPNLNEDNWKIKENKARPFGEIRKGYTHFAEGDVLFAKITPCMENGKSAIARNLVNRIGCGTTELHVIRPHGGIPPEFVYYYIHQESFRQEAEACMTGTAGQLRVPVDFVASASIPIPPLQEQILIVNRIELLLERTRKAKESLEKIPRIMKLFRQAALKKAFSGELTAEWRGQQQDLEPAAELLKHIQEERESHHQVKSGQKRPTKLKKEDNDTSELPELPEKWVWTRLGIISKTTSGGTPSRKYKKFFGGNIPWLKSGELHNGLIKSAEESITEDAIINSSTKIIPKGTLLIALYGATVGKLGILGIDSAINQAICAISTKKSIDQKLLFWYLTSYRNELLNARIGGAQPNISQQILNDVPIPLLPLPEQQEIVSRIDALFKFADETEKNAAEARKRVEIMTQSILARALRGDLSADFREAVRNWKDLDVEARGRYVFVLPEEKREKVLDVDEFPMEPASRLLERIRDERTKNERGTKSTRIKGRKQKEEVSPDVGFKDEFFVDNEGKV